MRGDYFDDFLPQMICSDGLILRDRRDMVNLGKENLQFLARFWKKRAEKMYAKVRTESNFDKREKFRQDAEKSAFKAREIKKIAEDAESKPLLFGKPTYKTGSRVTCFLPDPDRFVSGIVTKIVGNTDEETFEVTDGVFTIRILADQRAISFVPEDGFSMFMTADFEYFKAHPSFFMTYLYYYAWTIPQRDKAERMISCISSLPDPPEAA